MRSERERGLPVVRACLLLAAIGLLGLVGAHAAFHFTNASVAPSTDRLRGEPPVNDDCVSAFDIDPLPAVVNGDSTNATSDVAVPCGPAVDGPFHNVWFKVTGTGGTLTATTCSATTEIIDTEVSVFCADCDTLVCVDGNDDGCPGFPSQSTVSWCSQLNRIYFITVGGADSGTPTGVFELTVTDAGDMCPDPIDCTVMMGACCSLGVCVENTLPGGCDGEFFPGESCPDFVCPGPQCFCDDGLFCNGLETCDEFGGCIPGTPVDCSFLNDQCNVGVCDEGTDTCVRQPVVNGTPCNDGLFCTVSDTCTGGMCGGNPNPCGDGVFCTDDSCDEIVDMCVHVPNNANCPDDGLFCNGVQTCDAVLGCQQGPPPCSPPLHCDETTDTCVDCLTNTDCPSDNNDCTMEQCINHTCVHTPVPGGSVCADEGVPCTTDRCDDAGHCVHTPDNTQCPPDNDACTTTICHPMAGCVNVPNNPGCDDGLFCNGVESCDPQSGCVPGTPVDCSFLNSICNVGVCDEASDSCVRQPVQDGKPCKDGQFCTSGDTCEGGMCVGPPRDCRDNNVCTDDTCDELTNMCVHTPNNANCDDGLFCNGVEICDPQNGCVPGTPVNCGDGVACTIDACSEALHACQHTPDNSQCNDGDSCTSDVCSATLGCQFTDNGQCGACCDRATTICSITTQAACNCADCVWTQGADCSQVDCSTPGGAIPTISQWGMVVLSLLLLCTAKIGFGRRAQRAA